MPKGVSVWCHGSNSAPVSCYMLLAVLKYDYIRETYKSIECDKSPEIDMQKHIYIYLTIIFDIYIYAPPHTHT